MEAAVLSNEVNTSAMGKPPSYTGTVKLVCLRLCFNVVTLFITNYLSISCLGSPPDITSIGGLQTPTGGFHLVMPAKANFSGGSSGTTPATVLSNLQVAQIFAQLSQLETENAKLKEQVNALQAKAQQALPES